MRRLARQHAGVADAQHLGRLRARGERPRRRAAKHSDELAALSFDHLVGAREQPVANPIGREHNSMFWHPFVPWVARS
jgi:hypothetical protein